LVGRQRVLRYQCSTTQTWKERLMWFCASLVVKDWAALRSLQVWVVERWYRSTRWSTCTSSPLWLC
jgi:hypothetical protein